MKLHITKQNTDSHMAKMDCIKVKGITTFSIKIKGGITMGVAKASKIMATLQS
jgi:hypothetical protein